MPIYNYACPACGWTTEVYRSITEAGDGPPTCECCQATTHRDFSAEIPSLPQAEFHKPIEMHSLALNHPDDIRAFKERNPDIECSMDPRDPLYGVPIARSRHDKVSVLRNEGWVEKS